MGLFTDDKGRPELVANPAILLQGAHYRPADEQSVSEAEEETPKQRARRELKKRMTDERLAKQKTEGTNPEKG
ncbi:hypothetical protein [Rhodococcus sp. A14]|uniref:hypothetical protein n=1 Tax=Rhodococcus sp. A14 TaxID=1194106 RepID=UPI0014230193|nr:hypothetical protein [Rhodococcus sp. A14]